MQPAELMFDDYQEFTKTTAKYQQKNHEALVEAARAEAEEAYAEFVEEIGLVNLPSDPNGEPNESIKKAFVKILMKKLDNDPIVYTAFGLAGEAGEIAEKVKKALRKTGSTKILMEGEKREEMAKEVGDVLWYVARLSDELDLPLSYVAKLNRDKLTDRKDRGVLVGEGDNR